mmetsp:Transcript_24207/g.31521  ORF Transcript_24207/g.31521 Transcript_24207/m.31521 type:complete len:164 (+) Transcript_24207:366-857(+)
MSRRREDVEAGANNNNTRQRKPKMRTASQSMLLLRQSSTVFKRAKEQQTPGEGGSPSARPSSSPVHNQDEEEPCYICTSSQANGVLMECGHGGLCYACGLELARKGQTCPLCRTTIAEVIQIESMSLSFGIASSSTQVRVSARGKRSDKPPNQNSHRGRGIAV